ncbi:MAG: protein-L-isoaspartate(D-aspartate) O-methyltransferase [Nitrospira sp.]|nr:protein-L-isoaspartate(D-aspartate) O-methyltransferase [Nitrospira sp.]
MNSRLTGIGMTSTRTRERLVGRLRETGIMDESVLRAMKQIPRHLFVDEALATRAYEDTALPIGHSQTISQPYTVARMSELAIADGARRILEIGTGSGYQTAVLCVLASEVFSVERIEPLQIAARHHLQELGFRNFRLKIADGSLGWAEYAPYDAIVVTAAAAVVPDALLEQLAPGGRLVIPVGNAGSQELLLVRKGEGEMIRETIAPAHFVPLIQGA